MDNYTKQIIKANIQGCIKTEITMILNNHGVDQDTVNKIVSGISVISVLVVSDCLK